MRNFRTNKGGNALWRGAAQTDSAVTEAETTTQATHTSNLTAHQIQ